MNGIINVYKEKGFTSHDVVAKLRGILKMKKIGHTGTLDPDAEGVLPVCIGKATKICDMLTVKNKVYRAIMLLGKSTDTQDISGKVLKEKECIVSKDEIIDIIISFVGIYAQIPPMYSALKVNGKKLYELAREGKIIEREARKVEIYNIDIINMDIPRITMDVSCSKGTYIRTLCNDIGEKAGCGGCMEELLRVKSGIFNIESALKLSEIEELVKQNKIEEHIMSIDSIFNDFKEYFVDGVFNKILYNGNKLPIESIVGEDITINDLEHVRLYDENNDFIGIYEYKEIEKSFKPVKIFIER